MQVQGFNPAIPFLFVREVLQGLKDGRMAESFFPSKGAPRHWRSSKEPLRVEGRHNPTFDNEEP